MCSVKELSSFTVVSKSMTSLGTNFKLGKKRERYMFRRACSIILKQTKGRGNRLLCWSNQPHIMRVQRTSKGYCKPSRCCSYCPITQFREIGTSTLQSTNCQFVVQSEDGDIDPLDHGITSNTRPQSASPGESSQSPCFCSTNWPEAESEFGISLTTRQRVGIFYHSGIGNMSAGKPTAILVSF